jgi:hypothetical protein
LDEAKSIKAPLVNSAAGERTPDSDAGSRTNAKAAPSLLIQTIMKEEHAAFSGEPGASLDETPRTTKGARNRLNQSQLPPALLKRIANYSAEKASLQSALAAKIKGLSAGEETRRAIDAFNADNANRIASLGQTREGIRSELAQLASTGQTAGDRSLDALRRQFAADVENLETPRQ